jgi:hypothetical protein
MIILMISTLRAKYKYKYNSQVEEDEMGGACRTNEGGAEER